MDYRVETIKWQIRPAYGCLGAGQSSWARAYTAAYSLYARFVCDTTAPLQLQYAYAYRCVRRCR